MSDQTPLDPTRIDHAPSKDGAAGAGGHNSGHVAPHGRAPEPSTAVQGSNGAPPSAGAPPGYSYSYGSNVLGETDIHLLDYIRVLYKRRWMAMTAFLVVFVSVTIYAFTATPIYESKVQILIEKENANV